MMKGKISKTCCFSGYRPRKLIYLNELDDPRTERLTEVLLGVIAASVDEGYTTFVSGFALGVDRLAARLIVELKQDGYPLNLVAALPFRPQELSDAETDSLLDFCDEVRYVSECYSAQCFMERNRYMVDHSQRLIAVYHGLKGGTANTVAYARKRCREVLLINPESFSVSCELPEPELFAVEDDETINMNKNN